MLEPVTATIIATLITSSVTLIVAVLTHLKSSKCCGFDFEFNLSINTNTSSIPTNNTSNQQNSTNIIKS